MTAARCTTWLYLATLMTATLAAAENPPKASAQRDAKAAARLREGTQLHDRTGRFNMSSQRVQFMPDDKAPDSIRVLENLALERITAGLHENQESSRWVVSGTITEYRGVNYLLITRAVMHDGKPPANK